MKFTSTITGIIFISVLVSFKSFGQDVQFSASAPPVVEVGEDFRLTFSLNSQGDNLLLPDLDNFQIMSGPHTSRSSSIQIINGRRTQTQSVSYTFILRAVSEGSYTIDPATITVDSDDYKSNQVEIVVVRDSQGRSTIPQQQPPGSGSRPSDMSGEDLFIRVLLDKKEVFQGEAVVATIKLFSRLDITGIENVRFPSFSDFFQQDIDIPPLRSLDREVIDGVVYGTGVLRQVILFPQRSGEIKIEPFGMDALVRQRTPRRGSLFDDYFGAVETKRIRVESPAYSLNVKPLPYQKPQGFNGAIGDFNLNVDVDPGETKVNEAINLRITISGKGNLQLLSNPEIEFPVDFEVYDPNIRNNIINSSGGQEGSITWEYLVIPRAAGEFSIPPVQFSYFDPVSAEFRTLDSESFNLIVEKGIGDDGGQVGGILREDLQIVGSDIRFIKTSGAVFTRIGHDPFGSFGFYLWFLVPLALFTGFVVFYRKSIRDRNNTTLVRNRRASRMVRRRLKSAGTYLKANEHKLFYEEMLRAQWDYLSDKLLIPVSELNREKAKGALLEKNVPEKDTERLIEIINDCEFARYAPSSEERDMNRLYEDSIQIITSIEQKIRK